MAPAHPKHQFSLISLYLGLIALAYPGNAGKHTMPAPMRRLCSACLCCMQNQACSYRCSAGGEAEVPRRLAANTPVQASRPRSTTQCPIPCKDDAELQVNYNWHQAQARLAAPTAAPLPPCSDPVAGQVVRQRRKADTTGNGRRHVPPVQGQKKRQIQRLRRLLRWTPWRQSSTCHRVWDPGQRITLGVASTRIHHSV